MNAFEETIDATLDSTGQLWLSHQPGGPARTGNDRATAASGRNAVLRM